MSKHQEDMTTKEKYEIAEKIDQFMKEIFELRCEVVEFFMGKEIDMETAIITMKTLSVDCTESLMKNRDGEHTNKQVDKLIDDKIDMFLHMKPLYQDYEKSGDIH